MLGVLPLSTAPIGAQAPVAVGGDGGPGGPKWAPLLIILTAQK